MIDLGWNPAPVEPGLRFVPQGMQAAYVTSEGPDKARRSRFPRKFPPRNISLHEAIEGVTSLVTMFTKCEGKCLQCKATV